MGKQTRYIGEKFGRLTIIGGPFRRNKQTYYLCKCDCGNEKEVRGSHLSSRSIQSCGCLRKEKISQMMTDDLTGQIFGQLMVLERDYTKKKSNAYWYCKCKCGNIVSVRGIDLKNGHTQSCGCVKSLKEEIIEKILKENHVEYKREYSFPDLKGDKYKLRFDFAIFKNNKLKYLIEYQGEQHFKSIPNWGGEEALAKQKRYDLLKQEYCNNNKIPLILLSKEDDITINSVIIGGYLDE